ncbi:MAG: hypothetical protein ABGY95_05855 [Rubritalea sp.]|uniref:hypothetical protein n=1 Tax=Rubritalea sp. TaxID=2109375 RepID=UPI003242123D
MLFSRQKKLQRDRHAGLVFCWRGGQSGNRGGMVFSVLIASGLFALAFWGISLDFKTTKPESRKYAKILLVDEFSAEMSLWVDQNSPFPSRWDPLEDGAHQDRVDSELNVLFQQMTTPPSPWLEMPNVAIPLSVPALIERGVVELGSLPKVMVYKPKKEVLELVVSLAALGEFEKRQPRAILPMNVVIPKQAYGSILRFVVTLDARGKVVFIAPSEWREGEYEKKIENWLKMQQFAPSKSDDLEVGEVSIKVEVRNHAGN